jgi:hypothetical protein
VADPARDTPDTPTDTTEGPETVNETAHHPETAREDTEPVTVATPLGSTAAGTPHPDLAFSGYTGATGVEAAPIARRRGPDPLALLVGLATLAMAVFAFVGELPDLSGVDPRWLLAGGAALVGLVLLVGSLRGRSGGRRS